MPPCLPKMEGRIEEKTSVLFLDINLNRELVIFWYRLSSNDGTIATQVEYVTLLS